MSFRALSSIQTLTWKRCYSAGSQKMEMGLIELDQGATKETLRLNPKIFLYAGDGRHIEYHFDPHHNSRYDNPKKCYGLLNFVKLSEKHWIKYSYDEHTKNHAERCIRKTLPDDRFVEIASLTNGKLTSFRALGIGLGAEIGSGILIEFNDKILTPHHDQSGNLVLLGQDSCSYSAFGEASNTLSYPWAFSSKRFDPETGFTFFGRRYYDVSFSRWISCDPLGFTAGINLYAYVNNSPLIRFDEYGLDWLSQQVGKVQGVADFAIGQMEFAHKAHYYTNPFGWAMDAYNGGSKINEIDQFYEGLYSKSESYLKNTFSIQPNDLDFSTNRLLGNTSLTLATLISPASFKNAAQIGYQTFKSTGSLFKVAQQGAKWLTGSKLSIYENSASKLLPFLQEGKNYKSFTKQNFRSNLIELTGSSPGKSAQAHHVFPQMYMKEFINRGINIHNPKYGTWWETTSHQRYARKYNDDWIKFLKNEEITGAQILDRGKELMSDYGINVNY